MLKFIKIYESEKEYRADKTAYNYSLLKDFESMSLLGFRKNHILGKKDDASSDMNTGTLGHMKLAEDEVAFENAIYLSNLISKPKPQETKFAEELFKLTLEHSNEDNVYVGDFMEDCQEAYRLAEIQSPLFPNFIKKFEGGPAEDYYKELRNGYGRILVTQSDLEISERCIRKAKESPTVGDIINWKDRKNEIPIKFEYMGYTFRVLLDRMNFDHENEELSPYDWKFTHATDEKEFGYNFIDMKYYLQIKLYSLGAEAYRDHFYPNYKLNPLKYVAIDNKAFSDSVEHEFEFSNWADPWTGFTHRGRKYRSIPEIIDTMEWHKQNDVWSMRKSTFLNKGKVKHIIGE